MAEGIKAIAETLTQAAAETEVGLSTQHTIAGSVGEQIVGHSGEIMEELAVLGARLQSMYASIRPLIDLGEAAAGNAQKSADLTGEVLNRKDAVDDKLLLQATAKYADLSTKSLRRTAKLEDPLFEAIRTTEKLGSIVSTVHERAKVGHEDIVELINYGTSTLGDLQERAQEIDRVN